MGRKKIVKTVPDIRYRVNVPIEDEAVQCWIENQRNLSLSVRQLIKNQVGLFGFMDMFSSTISQDGLPVIASSAVSSMGQIPLEQVANVSGDIQTPVVNEIQTVSERVDVQIEPEIKPEIESKQAQTMAQPEVIVPPSASAISRSDLNKLNVMHSMMNDI